MKKHVSLVATLLVTTAIWTAAGAKTVAQSTDGISPATEKFITGAVIGNRLEIDSSKLALDRSEDPTVREFAKMMVEDHEAAMENMKSVVPNDSAPALGADYDAKHQQKLDALRNTSEANFDAAYVKTQTEAHDEAVALFSGYAQSGDEKDLKQFAAATLPTLKAHQAEIKSFRKTADGYQAAASKTPVTKDAGHTHAVER